MKKYLPIALILVAGTILRFYHNTDISLWHDEAFSALLIKYPWSEMMYRIGLDVHPPMYYVFLRFWHYIFGDSLLSLRAMTVFFGVGTIWAGWMLVKAAFTDSGAVRGSKMALWAALLIAVNPFQVQYATEARMYTMGAFFAVLSAYFITKALRSQKAYYEDAKLNMPNMPQDISLRRNMFWNYVGFTLSIIVLIYTHYYLLFTAAAICFYALVYHVAHYRFQIKKYIALLGSYLVIVLAYVPWLKTFLYQYKQVGEGYWIPKMDVWSIPSTLWQLLVGFGYNLQNSTTQKWMVVVTLVTVFILFRFVRKTQAFEKWLVLLAILAPFAGAVLFLILARLKGSDSSVYLVRYFLYTSAFLSIAVAVWLAQFKTKYLGAVLIFLYVVMNLGAVHRYWKDLNVLSKPGMNAAAKYLQANVEPGHHVFVGTSFEFFNYKYYNNVYYPVPTRPLLFTGGTRHAKEISHFAGSAILTDEDLVPVFAERVKSGDTVWMLWTTAFGSNLPEVPKNWTKIQGAEKEFPEVRPYPTSVNVTEYKVN